MPLFYFFRSALPRRATSVYPYRRGIWMPFTMNLYYKGKGRSAEAFVREVVSSGLLERIRSSEGNLGYAYFLSLEDPETVLLIDSWDSQECLDKYHSSPLMEEIGALREKYGLSVQAKRFVEEGVPSKDASFLKRK